MFFDLSERLGRGNISWLVLIAEAEGSPWTLSGMPVLGEAEMECACSFTNTLTALVRLVAMTQGCSSWKVNQATPQGTSTTTPPTSVYKGGAELKATC